ncbi:type II toxin-antitoxin system HicB family antitoxin [Rhizobium sp. C1]|uniref:type II toxin-antitoxin system HicB family antitoxin n=1 Tax=Rhizobium sp. C1 TaxID=1349799 RepID=UPI001E3CB340|nr:type II toxin-antitoxin system HicB family antitoxin [Rhizobium sp. C1]MCD2177480.1 type II toxin-antitoxin system HicB family antitoxin [Rhizobium sp. C1]
MKALEYAVLLSPLSEDEGGGFVATVPDLPGCMSDGETPEEALANVQDAIDCWIEAAIDHGRAVPSPTIAHERRASG